MSHSHDFLSTTNVTNISMKRDMELKLFQLFEKIAMEEEKLRAELESKRGQLNNWQKELEKREAPYNERATLEIMLRLIKDHEMEKEILHVKILDLKKMLDAKQQLELEIEGKKGNLRVLKVYMGDYGDLEFKKKMEAIEVDLKEKEMELEVMKIHYEAIVKELNINDEVQEARNEFMHLRI